MFIVGIRKVILPAVFNFTACDPLEFYFLENEMEARRYNAVWFVHIFFIPLIPIRYSEALWKAQGSYYKREIHRRAKLIHYCFCLVGLVVALFIAGGIANSFSSGGHFRVRYH